MLIIIFFIFGLIIGSFLNVLVYRIHEGKGIFWGGQLVRIANGSKKRN